MPQEMGIKKRRDGKNPVHLLGAKLPRFRCAAYLSASVALRGSVNTTPFSMPRRVVSVNVHTVPVGTSASAAGKGMRMQVSSTSLGVSEMDCVSPSSS